MWSKSQAKVLLSKKHIPSEAPEYSDTFYDAGDTLDGNNEDFLYGSLDAEKSNLKFSKCSDVDKDERINPCPSLRELTSPKPTAIFSFGSESGHPITPSSVTPKSDQKQYSEGPNPLQSLDGIEFTDERPGRPAQAFDVGLSDPSTLGNQTPPENLECDKASEIHLQSEIIKTKTCDEAMESKITQPVIAIDNEDDDHLLAFREALRSNKPSDIYSQEKSEHTHQSSKSAVSGSGDGNAILSRSDEFENVFPLVEENMHGCHISAANSRDEQVDNEGDEDDSSVPWSGQHILDVGAGDGHVTRVIADGAASVSATEISTVMRSRLNQKGYR